VRRGRKRGGADEHAAGRRKYILVGSGAASMRRDARGTLIRATTLAAGAQRDVQPGRASELRRTAVVDRVTIPRAVARQDVARGAYTDVLAASRGLDTRSTTAVRLITR